MASAAHAEAVLYTYLSDAEALDVLAHEGFLAERNREVIPTETGRRVVEWALQVYFDSGRTLPPTREAILETWGDALEAAEISLGDGTETDSVQWAIEHLRSHHALVKSVGMTNGFAKSMKAADPVERVELVVDIAEKLYLLSQSITPRRKEMNGQQGIEDALLRYNDRLAAGGVLRGLTFGVPEIDAHTFGIHPGEICTCMSRSGTGKSWWAGYVCLQHWRRGGKPLLVTLENDLQMTYDRLACIGTGIDYQAWQRAEVHPDKMKAAFELLEELAASENKPMVTQLPPEERTASGVVRKAFLEEADAIILDQLSFLHAEGDNTRRARHEQVKAIMFRLKELINDGVLQIPLLLFSQMNREGSKAAAKGDAVQEHAAESSAVEQTSDTVWLINRADPHPSMGTAELEELKSRRTRLASFTVDWAPERGLIRVSRSGLGTEDLVPA